MPSRLPTHTAGHVFKEHLVLLVNQSTLTFRQVSKYHTAYIFATKSQKENLNKFSYTHSPWSYLEVSLPISTNVYALWSWQLRAVFKKQAFLRCFCTYNWENISPLWVLKKYIVFKFASYSRGFLLWMFSTQYNFTTKQKSYGLIYK